MTPDEKRGYSRGYAAGRKTRKQLQAAERLRQERQAFLDRAFLVALPQMLQGNWTRGGKPVTTIEDRVALAWQAAAHALKARKAAL